MEALGLDSEDTVVDIGCGTGCALRYASDQATNGSLIPVPSVIDIALEKTAGHSAAGRTVYHRGSAEELPIEDATADVVLAFDSYDHWEDPHLGLAELGRVLQSNGRFVVLKDGGLADAEDAESGFMSGLIGAGFKVAKQNKYSGR